MSSVRRQRGAGREPTSPAGRSVLRVDPLAVLPPEVTLLLLHLLAPRDLLALARVSRGWRCAARDPALWRNRTLRLPGDANTPVALLHAAPLIGHLQLAMGQLEDRHVDALLSGQAQITRLTLLPGSVSAWKVLRILSHVARTSTVEVLEVQCDIRRAGIEYGPNHSPEYGLNDSRRKVMKTIGSMRHLRELTLHEIDWDGGKVEVPRGYEPHLERLCVINTTSGMFARVYMRLIKNNSSTLRSVEIHDVTVLNPEIAARLRHCQDLTRLTMSLQRNYPSVRLQKRMYEELPKHLLKLEDLTLEVPCLMDTEPEIAKLAAGVARYRALRSVQIVVLCNRPTRPARLARATVTEAKLRSVLRQGVAVEVRAHKVGKAYYDINSLRRLSRRPCYCEQKCGDGDEVVDRGSYFEYDGTMYDEQFDENSAYNDAYAYGYKNPFCDDKDGSDADSEDPEVEEEEDGKDEASGKGETSERREEEQEEKEEQRREGGR